MRENDQQSFLTWFRRWLKPGWIGLLLIAALEAGAQEIIDEGPMSDSLEQELDFGGFDTLALSMFYLDDIDASMPFRDSVLDYRFLHYNPVFEQKNPHLFLGNNGSAAIPVTQLFKRKSGFDLGLHAYDIYSMQLDSFRWYRTNLPFSDLFFSGGPSEDDFRVAAKYTMNFSNNWNLNLDYERIIESGYYQNQETKQSSISVGMWHRSADERKHTFISYIGNIHQEKNNGGVRDLTFFNNPANSIRSVIPVNLSNAVGRYQNNSFALVHYRSLFNKPDSLQIEDTLGLTLITNFNYENGFFKYYDDGTSTQYDSSYYGALLIDDAGIRNYITFDKFGLKPAIQGNFKWNTRAKLGLNYNWLIIDQEPQDAYSRHDLRVFGNFKSSPTQFFGLSGDLNYHLGAFGGDYDIKIAGYFRLKKILVLEASQSVLSGHPSLIEETFFVSRQPMEANSFKNVNTSKSSVGIGIPYLKFNTTISLTNIQNHIYYTPDAFFEQIEGGFQLLDVHVTQHLAWKKIHLNLGGHWYEENTDVLDVPNWYLYSRLYFRGPVLKNRLILNTGLEFSWMEGFYVPGYQATVGQFYQQDAQFQSAYPLLNFYLGARINSFRLFVRTENILNAITNEVHFHSYLFPQNDFRAFRLGIRWQFMN